MAVRAGPVVPPQPDPIETTKPTIDVNPAIGAALSLRRDTRNPGNARKRLLARDAGDLGIHAEEPGADRGKRDKAAG